MLCHQCGSPVQAVDRSCPNCGASLVKTSRLSVATSKGIRISQELKAIKIDDQLFPPGERLSERYALGELIGKGPFGEVYKAHDQETDLDVAVKVFAKSLIASAPQHERFMTAGRHTRTLSQGNLVRIHDSGVHKGHPWVSMQYLEGLSLRKVLNLRRTKNEHFTLEEIEPVVTQIGLALSHGERGVPCLDLKPENIIFLPDLLKVTDTYLSSAFGFEAVRERSQESVYLAPELHTPDAEPDVRADVYSLGVIVGEMAFGPDYSPGAGVPAGMEALDTLCRRATAFAREERYPSVEALVEDLTTLVDTGSLLEMPAPPPAPAAPPRAPSTQERAALAPPPPPAEPPRATPDRAATKAGEEDSATVEYSRDEPELMDVLPTNEISRTPIKRPEVPRGPATRINTQTMNTAAPQAADEGGKGWWIASAVLLLAAGVIGYQFLKSGSNSDEVVQLGSAKSVTPKVDPNTTQNASTKVAPMTAAQNAPNPTQVAQTTNKTAEQVVPAQTATQTAQSGVQVTFDGVTAAQKPVETAVGARVEQTGGTTEVAKPVEVVKPAEVVKPVEPVKPVETTKPTETKPAETTQVQAAQVTEKPVVSPAAGTNCPSGMVLVKAKAGNYCVDAYEFPGSGAPPKVRVNWFEASKTCASSGKRLCTLAEWRGACGGKYPYGSTFDANACNTADEDGFERSLANAGSNKKCRSKSGAYDMSGNVHEWVEEKRIAGGSYESDEEVSSCRYSSAKAPGSSAADIGFRCCANPQ